MTNILIPTDFTPASLSMAESALKSGHYEKCNLFLFHAFSLPPSPLDMLGEGYQDPATKLVTEPFRQACKALKDAYPGQVNIIAVRSMAGSTRAVFRNFAEANDIDLIYCPEHYTFQPVHERSVDPVYLFKKSGIPVIRNRSAQREVVFEPAYFATVPLSSQ